MPVIALRIDPWPAEYESSFLVDEIEQETASAVETDVEGIGWQPIEPEPGTRPDLIHFVDGVRRVEARIIVDDGSGRIIRGLYGSVGVGSVRSERGVAVFESIRVNRYMVVGAGGPIDDELITEATILKIGNTELIFEPFAVVDSTPLGAIAGLQNSMRTSEAILAEELAKQSDCVFADGPLTYFSGIKQPAVGIIKRLIEPYLPAAQFDVVRRLRTGQRTPLFAITQAKYERYSWYLRVGTPRVMDHDVTGVLRLEVRSGVGLARAVELADMSAACLPSFAGPSFRDPRAPQNLLPIGGLENKLRHRLGDAQSIRRAIETKLFKMSETVIEI